MSNCSKLTLDAFETYIWRSNHSHPQFSDVQHPCLFAFRYYYQAPPAETLRFTESLEPNMRVSLTYLRYAYDFCHAFYQMGKLHFGVILGWSVVASGILFLIVNQIAGQGNPDSQSIVLYSCCCLLGYCLIPIVILSSAAILLPGCEIFSFSNEAL